MRLRYPAPDTDLALDVVDEREGLLDAARTRRLLRVPAKLTVVKDLLDQARPVPVEAVLAPQQRGLLRGENLPALRARSDGETVWLVDRAALPEDFRGPR